MLDHPAMRGRRRAAWVVVLALMIGVGLIAMHTGVSGHHAHASAHGPALVPTAGGSDTTHAPLCEECASHAAMTVMCAVLLVAGASGVAVRVLRRLGVRAQPVGVAPVGALRCSRTAVSALARPPNLHALQVMRC